MLPHAEGLGSLRPACVVFFRVGLLIASAMTEGAEPIEVSSEIVVMVGLGSFRADEL